MMEVLAEAKENPRRIDRMMKFDLEKIQMRKDQSLMNQRMDLDKMEQSLAEEKELDMVVEQEQELAEELDTV
ncbi:hypothetical protein BpHYR1_052596 [Brachionus plicatilis]|uniref:Uncharacterized protein n=1 Tax=Brachionus plicatilis TaxID=10195 RepID=A0A3M7Q2D2_BRAPC|nr:hypothetical protein BpHYR1_052596 [Brachionus plicatilis]